MIEFTQREESLIKKDFFVDKSKSWSHFAILTLKPSKEDLHVLGQYISMGINTSPIQKLF